MDFKNPMYSGGCNVGSVGGCSNEGGSSCSVCGSRAPSCKQDSWALKDYPLAMVYSPYQTFCDLYDAEKALKQGTLFKALNLPFEGTGNGSCREKGCCR